MEESVTVEVSAGPERAFALAADFGRLAEWDPSVVSSEWRGDGQRVGATCDVVARFLGNRPRIEYELVELDPPRRAVYRGRASAMTSVDTVAIDPSGGTSITFSASIRFAGLLRLASPLLGVIFRRQSRESAEALRRALS